MSVLQMMPISKLLDLAKDGFPSMSFGDLLQATSDWIERAATSIRDKKYDEDEKLFEVICQAHSNAVAMGGEVLSERRLSQLEMSLHQFDDLLETVIDSDLTNHPMRDSVKMYKSHTERRVYLVSDLKKQLEAAERQDAEIDRLFTGIDFPADEQEERSVGKIRPR